jgi:uncharacterized protein (TIGR03435 family)
MSTRLPLAACVACLLPSGVFGQPAFEVASITPYDGISMGVGRLETFPRRLSAWCSLRQLIESAYTLEPWQLSGGPAVMEELFHVEAAAPEDLSRDTDRVLALEAPVPRKMMLMLQTLLAERFKLKVHREAKQDNVYSLIVAKSPPNLKPPQEVTRSYVGSSRTGDYMAPAVTSIIMGHNASMEQLANYLARIVRRPVSDDTGIKGNYDFRIEYAPENSPAVEVPPFFPAIEAVTGLKLKAAKGPVEFLVVDHVEKPTPN